uniref:Uncharacterized protein n=1 Tax=Romanomermis culicivorax TaxID=13658 RepID=A0A915J1G5_ROMCU
MAKFGIWKNEPMCINNSRKENEISESEREKKKTKGPFAQILDKNRGHLTQNDEADRTKTRVCGCVKLSSGIIAVVVAAQFWPDGDCDGIILTTVAVTAVDGANRGAITFWNVVGGV